MPPAAAAKSLQSSLTLCDPRDGSPPGSPVPGILQARTLEWIATAFSKMPSKGENFLSSGILLLYYDKPHLQQLQNSTVISSTSLKYKKFQNSVKKYALVACKHLTLSFIQSMKILQNWVRGVLLFAKETNEKNSEKLLEIKNKMHVVTILVYCQVLRHEHVS